MALTFSPSVPGISKTEMATMLAREDHRGLVAAVRAGRWRVLRFLIARLSSADSEEKWRAVRALGALAAQAELLPRGQAVELLRRFLWALNDESGAVPFGIPEALAEVLAARQELQPEFVPILGSFLTSDEMCQTGPIEQGVIWGLGRLGPAVAEYAPHALPALHAIATNHPDPNTQTLAQKTLAKVGAQSLRPGDVRKGDVGAGR